MKLTPANTITDVNVLGDCWMGRTRAAQYLGISDETFRRWNARGKCLPHHVDKVTGRAMWKKDLLDNEMLHGKGDSVIRQAISSMRARGAIKKGLKK